MALGVLTDQATINRVVGDVFLAIHTNLLNLRELKAYFDRFSSADLQANQGYSAADADNLKTAINVMDQLRQVYETGTPPGANPGDYLVFARPVIGLGV